jgi:hypothetical protein
MGRRSACRNSLRYVAAIAAAALGAWLGGGAALGASADAALTCGDLITCLGGCGCDGPGGSFCGNLVTPKGGCASGYEMWWFDAQYMLWQRNGFSLPPLVTASLSGDPSNGILGEPGTTILFGNETVSDHVRSGFGLQGGYWLDPCAGWGIAADYFNAGRDSSGIVVGPTQDRVLARPFLDAQSGQQMSSVINVPNELTGVLTVAAFDDFQGAGAWMQKCIWSQGNGCTAEGTTRLNLLGGYRYYHQDSLVFVREDFGALAGNVDGFPAGFEHHAFDKFAGRNEFHGAELGLEGRLQRCRWWCEGLAAVAVGPTRHVMFVEGYTVSVPPAAPATIESGNLLVSGVTNFGRYTRDNWQAIPRFRVGAGWQLNEWVSLKLGYNLVIWDIIQAADGLPPALEVDRRNLPTIQNGGGAEPVFPGLRERTMVAHGLDLGVELSF